MDDKMAESKKRTNLGCPKCSYSTSVVHELKQHLKTHADSLVQLYELIELSELTRDINDYNL